MWERKESRDRENTVCETHALTLVGGKDITNLGMKTLKVSCCQLLC